MMCLLCICYVCLGVCFVGLCRNSTKAPAHGPNMGVAGFWIRSPLLWHRADLADLGQIGRRMNSNSGADSRAIFRAASASDSVCLLCAWRWDGCGWVCPRAQVPDVCEWQRAQDLSAVCAAQHMDFEMPGVPFSLDDDNVDPLSDELLEPLPVLRRRRSSDAGSSGGRRAGSKGSEAAEGVDERAASEDPGPARRYRHAPRIEPSQIGRGKISVHGIKPPGGAARARSHLMQPAACRRGACAASAQARARAPGLRTGSACTGAHGARVRARPARVRGDGW